jgi:hypothetical protein
LGDLDEDDMALFKKDHGGTCPGLAKVNFYGDGAPTFAMVLIMTEGEPEQAELIVAHERKQTWETTLLETAPSSVPVVWSQKPGEYKDVYGEKKIRARNPVIVFCGHNAAWVVVYAWTGSKTDKIWLRD